MQAQELLAKARRVRLPGHGPADAVMAGQYRSAFRGSGMEFEESREYAPGDDAGALDWKVTARMGRPFVKRFREERERTVMLAVDVSRSMADAAPGGPPLAEAAAVAACALALGAAASRDRVGLVLFSDRVEAFVPPGKGPGRAVAVAHALAGTTPAGTGTDPGPAMALLAAALAHRSVVFVFSDFLGQGFAAPLGRLARRHEVAAVLLAGPGAGILPPYGLLTVSDLETGARATLDCGDPAARTRYAAARTTRREALLAGLRAAGADLLELPADAPPDAALTAFFHRRGRGGRVGKSRLRGA
ncbi:protein of unknown function DUF58 [Solidesulfovibrio carbinoliphilus subsp. oakridgensis]|uniref:VWFA domain-containing protein n=1 Tax=Solidesulfovibrio carbinoliphilus subsp. oakridgensis TaxID=694327 RepID=G7Q7Y3_9BACT|nr:DUF58 domain-containing protein [Solidesulfovibrio carbinoliphilus]EHJ47677.1 protein of unknown function DUF58 [Solidesulfovibrio carbinoliphilus subsp. oakridgensis]